MSSDKDVGLVANTRPAAFEVTGQQRELFPFDAFEYIKDEGDGVYQVKLKSPWKFLIEGTLEGADGTFTGTLSAGTVSGSTVSGNTITGGSIKIGTPGSEAFQVASNGALTATSGTFTGTVTGSTVTGSTITGGSLKIGTAGSEAFQVSSAGVVSATSGTFSGDITGASGTFSGSVGIGIGDASFRILNITVI